MSRFLNVVICAMLASPLCPQAATYYWDNNGTTAGFGTAGGTWAVPTASQWSTDSTGVAAPGASITTTSADPVNFGTTATGLLAGTITISGSVTNGSLTFGSTNGAVVLDGGTINLNGNIAVSANSPAATQTVNSAIVLIGSRQFGAALANERIIFNGAISGTSGSGLTADTGNGSGSITLNGTNSFPGNVTIGRGQLNANTIADAGVNSSLGAGTNITMAYGGGQNPAFVYSGASAGSMNRNFMLNGGSDYIFSQGAPLTLSGTFSNSAAGFNAGLFLSGDAGGGANINELSGAIVSGGVYTINVTVQNLTPVGGTAEEGMWKLSGNNTYTGATAVANASTLIVAHNNALGATGGGVALTQNAQLLLMNNIAVGAEALTLNSGQGATWNGQTGAALRNYLGTNSWSGLITLSAASTIAANSGTALTLSGGITGAQNLTVNAIGDITVTNTGITTGTGTLTKSGAGRLTLAATNTYSGATTVSNGTLKAGSTGGLSSNSTFTVVAGATLDLGGFNNAINSLSTVNNGGTITDSSSPGSGGMLRITNVMSSTLNSNVFTGSLGLQFFGGGTVNTILNVTTNTYSGGTILGNGSGGTSTRLLLGGGTLGTGSPGAITSGLFGKGPITIGAAATDLSQLYFGSALTVNYDFVVNSSLGTDVAGTFRAESSGIVLAGAINANLADAAFSANNATGRTISVTGPISGPSGVKVLTTGSGGLAVTSSGTNTFSGSITLSNGTLVLSGGLSTNMNQLVTTGSGSSLILTNGARLLNTNGYSVGGNSGTIALYSNTVWTLLRYPNNVTSLGGTSNRLLVTAGGIITNVSFAGGNILAINGNYGVYQVTDGGKIYLSAGNILLGQGTSSDNTLFVGGSGASSYFSGNLIQIPQTTGTGGRNGISVTNGTLDCFGGINLGRTTASQNFVRVFANGLVNMNDTSFVIADGGASIGNFVTIDQGVMTNVNGITIGNAAGANSNSMSIINGGQLWNRGALTVGNSATSQNNSVTIGGSGAASIVSNTTLNVGIAGSDFNSVTVTNATWWSSAATIGNTSSNNSITVLANATWNPNANIITVGVSPGTGNTLNVTGGLITNVSQIAVGSQNAVYVNGGTLAAGANGNLLSGAGNAYIRSGGATIDTLALAVTNGLILQEDSGSTGGGLTKRGSGTLTLLGANAYSGTTLVSSGSLRVNGSTAAGAVTVASGGTLGGTGTVGGAVAVDGAVAPGSDGIGRLTSSGSVTWNAGVAWPFQLGAGATNDRLSITGGNFTKGSGSGWAFDFANTGVAGVYTLVTWSASTTFAASDFSAINVPGSLAGVFSIVGNELRLTIQAVTNLTWDTAPGNSTITDGSGTWQVGVSNWYNGFNYDRTWLDGVTANFGGGTAGSAGTVTLGGDISVQGIVCTNAFAGDYTFNLSTNTLTILGGGVTLLGGNPVFTNGTLSLGAERIFTLDNTNTLTVASKVTGSGGVFKSNAGNLTLNNNSNDFTGRLYSQNGGSVSVSSISNSGVASAAGAGSLVEINQSGVFNYTGSGNTSIDRTLTLGNLNASGVNHWLRNNGGGSLIFRGPFNNSRGFVNGFFVLGGTNTGANEISFSMTNSVTNTLGLIKEDAGRWTLTGTNRYTGSTTISAGTLVLKSSNSSPSYAISANAVLELSTNAAPATATYSGSGTLRISGFVYAYADPGFAATFSMGSGGTIDIQSGAELYFGFGDDPWTSNLADLNVNGVLWGAANNIVVDVLTGNSSSFSMGAGTVIVGADNGSGTYSGRITDNYAPGNFLKIGSGTQTLSGTNIYSGTTFVSNGTLRVTGSLLSSGLVEVAGAGTLGGNGSVGRVLLRGGTISPGLSPGILSVSSLTMTSGTYRFEITNATGAAGVHWDLIRVGSGGGDVTNLANSSFPIVIELTYTNATLPNFYGTNALSWTIIDAGNQVGFASNKYTVSTANFMPPLHYDGSFTVSSNAGDLILNFIPNTNEVDLGVSIAASTNFVPFGSTNAFMVVVTNSSATASGSYAVTNTLSTNVTYAVAYSTTNPSTFEVTHFTANGGVFSGGTYANGSYSGGMVTWVLGGLGAGSSTSLYLYAAQSTFSSSTQEVNNVVTVTVSSSRPDPNAANNTSNSSFTTVGIPMLSTLTMLMLASVIAYAFYRRHTRRSELTG